MQSCRVARCVPRQTRNIFTPSLSLFPHHYNGFPGGDLFRLLDAAASDAVPSRASRPLFFQPRFDVKEVQGGYELQGDLPGVEQGDLSVEFVDERKLVIRGRSVREETSTNGNENKAVAATDAAKDDATSETSEKSQLNYQKPAVEEEYVDAGAESESGEKTPNSTSADNTVTVETKQIETKKAEPETEAFKYWVSERSVGEFERRFSFPGRVDQEGVKASLRNGVLSVVVPKIIESGARRIRVE